MNLRSPQARSLIVTGVMALFVGIVIGNTSAPLFRESMLRGDLFGTMTAPTPAPTPNPATTTLGTTTTMPGTTTTTPAPAPSPTTTMPTSMLPIGYQSPWEINHQCCVENRRLDLLACDEAFIVCVNSCVSFADCQSKGEIAKEKCIEPHLDEYYTCLADLGLGQHPSPNPCYPALEAGTQACNATYKAGLIDCKSTVNCDLCDPAEEKCVLDAWAEDHQCIKNYSLTPPKYCTPQLP